MGGKAIIPILNKNSERITKAEKNYYLSLLPSNFLPIREIASKEDFGDIDLLISNPNFYNLFETVMSKNNIKINGKIKNSEITSYAINDKHQIDLKFKNDSAIHEIAKISKSRFVNEIILLENHRHVALTEVLALLNDSY
jgi:hypothetical protein